MGLLDKIIGAVSGRAPSELTGAQTKQLETALAPLDQTQPGLAAQALAFVAQGQHEELLQTLGTLPGAKDLAESLGKPGRLRWGFGLWNQKAREAEAKKSLAARSEFYAGIDAAQPPLAVLARLGKLLAAADGGQSLDRTGAPGPEWLHYLVNDAWFASFNGRISVPESAKRRAAWSIHLIAQLLAQEELDPLLALQLVFERKELDSYYHDHLSALVLMPETAAFMRGHPEAAVAQQLARLSAAGRVVLAGRIGRDKALLADFAPLFVALAVDGSKTVRAEAAPHLEGIAQDKRLQLLGALLRGGDSTQRAQAADLLARWPAEDTRQVLEDALRAEASKPVQQALRTALTRLDAVDDAAAQAMPEAPPWQSIEDLPLDAAVVLPQLLQARAGMVERALRAAEEEIAENKTGKHKYKWRQENHKRLSKVGDEELRQALDVLNGKADQKVREALGKGNAAQVVNQQLAALPGIAVPHLVRWHQATRGWGSFWNDDHFQQWLRRQPQGSVDLRALAELLERGGMPARAVASAALTEQWGAPGAAEILGAGQVWPFFMEHPEYLDEALGLVPPVANESRRYGFSVAAALDTLATFPQVPARWLPSLMELALGEGKTHRAAAQKALARLPDIGRRVMESLSHGKSEVRIEAARWLADLRYAEALPALNEALGKESRETVRAAFLTALEALGEDIAPRLAPALLLAEAKKGLKARPPAGLAWFSMDSLPAGRWLDGSLVEPEIIRWWVVLATKLKEPGGNALLTRYLGLLDAPSRQQLAGIVLRQFIAQDTRHPSVEEGIAYAKAHAPQRYQRYQDSYRNAKPEYRQYYEADHAKSEEQVFEECRREKMGEYLGSAIGEKGLLALAMHIPGHEAASLLQQYMRDHYQRRAQIEAMLEGVAPGNDPLVIQLLLGLARRYRTASVQEKARALVQQIAERNGWTQDQLADRTIPTAGLDDSGTLTLQYGERVFTMTLDAAMKPELRNAEGKVVKALPEPRQNDDAAQIKEAKAQLSTSKKELKQVIDGQTARLFEAMCAGRVWPASEWREYLHGHPVMGRLIQRLVWLRVDGQGQVLASFRPTEDGSLIDTADDEVELPEDALLRLGHASLVPADEARAWVRHCKDYKIAPLFAQMAREAPALAFQDDKGLEVKLIKDREGWISDSFTLRGAFNKLGYQRAQAEDGGFFYEYTKDFSSVGIRVVMEFSGNTLPEENVSAALKTLRFDDARQRGWGDKSLPLAQVPPVLLSEAYADYLAVAQACSGYDAGWEKKMPW